MSSVPLKLARMRACGWSDRTEWSSPGYRRSLRRILGPGSSAGYSRIQSYMPPGLCFRSRCMCRSSGKVGPEKNPVRARWVSGCYLEKDSPAGRERARRPYRSRRGLQLSRNFRHQAVKGQASTPVGTDYRTLSGKLRINLSYILSGVVFRLCPGRWCPTGSEAWTNTGRLRERAKSISGAIVMYRPGK